MGLKLIQCFQTSREQSEIFFSHDNLHQSVFVLEDYREALSKHCRTGFTSDRDSRSVFFYNGFREPSFVFMFCSHRSTCSLFITVVSNRSSIKAMHEVKASTLHGRKFQLKLLYSFHQCKFVSQKCLAPSAEILCCVCPCFVPARGCFSWSLNKCYYKK